MGLWARPHRQPGRPPAARQRTTPNQPQRNKHHPQVLTIAHDDAVSALLARADGVCRTPNDRLLLLRVALHRTNRRAVLLAVERTAAWVQEIGGERALQRSMEAIRSVYTWWP